MNHKIAVFVFCVVLLSGTHGSGLAQEHNPQMEPTVDYTPHAWREWTYATGNQTIYGQYAKIEEKNKVVIFNREGNEVSIPIHRLIDEDIFEAWKSSAETGSDFDDEVELEFDAVQIEMTAGDNGEELSSQPVEQELELKPFEKMSDDEKVKLKEAFIKAAEEKKAQQKAKIENKARENRERVEAAQKNPANAEESASAAMSENEEKGSEKAEARAGFRKERERLAQWDKMRTWTDVTGKHTFEGQFQKIENQINVILRNEKEQEISLPLSKLSVDDIQVAVHGELCRPGGTEIRGIQVSSAWIPGKNKN